MTFGENFQMAYLLYICRDIKNKKKMFARCNSTLMPDPFFAQIRNIDIYSRGCKKCCLATGKSCH